MSINLVLLLTLPLYINAFVPLDSYQCGTSKSSRIASWLLTSNCEQEQMNRCCLAHDACYDSCSLLQSQCDAIFCDCLYAVPSTQVCRNLIESLHCTAVQLLGDAHICPSQAEPLFPPRPRTTLPPQVRPRLSSTVAVVPIDYLQYSRSKQLPAPIQPAYVGYARN